MDFSSILGIILGIGFIILAQTVEGGNMTQLYQPSAFLIVFGGTFAALLLSFSGCDLLNAICLLKDVFTTKKIDFNKQINEIVEIAAKARKEGILSLESASKNVQDELLKLGLDSISSGADPFLVKDMMENRLHQLEKKIHAGARVYEAAGGYAPTIGILGAVIGLIQVMMNLTNPSKLGMGIAVAFVATIYGVGLANLVLLPISNKIKIKNKQLILLKEVIIEGVLAIQAGESPVLIERKLKVFMSETC